MVGLGLAMRTPVLSLCTLAAIASAGCPGKRSGPVTPPSDPYPGREQRLQSILLRELEVEVLEGYELTSFETTLPETAVDGGVGGVHLGVGPDDLGFGGRGTAERWPLAPLDELGTRLDRADTKRLELHLAHDLSAAWVLDEVSYRIPGCLARDGTHKTVLVPLRMTAVYVRDGERWVPVAEHLSYPQPVGELIEQAGTLRGRKLRNARDPRGAINDVMAMLRRALSPALPEPERARLFASGEDAVAIWPDPEQELRRGAVVGGASLARLFDAIAIDLESWRVGMSPDPTGGNGPGSVVWVAATLRVDAQRARDDAVQTVPLRLRGTFVLEWRRPLGEPDGAPRWQIVQSHVSAPIDDRTLLRRILGDSAVEGAPPWQRPCEGDWTRPAPR
jgi:hypothetical protein